MWVGSGEGESFMDRLAQQNWQKTQYTVSDYAAAELSRYFKEIRARQAESARKKEEERRKREDIAGLGWLGTCGRILS